MEQINQAAPLIITFITSFMLAALTIIVNFIKVHPILTILLLVLSATLRKIFMRIIFWGLMTIVFIYAIVILIPTN